MARPVATRLAALTLAFPAFASTVPTPTALQPGNGGIFSRTGPITLSEPIVVSAGPGGIFAGLDRDRDTGFRTTTGPVTGTTTVERARSVISVSRASPPQVEAYAFATATGSGGSSDNATAAAASALVFELLVRQTGGSLLQGLVFDTAPLLATIQVKLDASVNGALGGPQLASAGARAEVAGSFDPISINPDAGLVFDRSNSQTVAGGVFADLLSGVPSDVLDPPAPLFAAFGVPVGQTLFIGKSVDVQASATSSASLVGADVEAILDPLISFDQDAFQALYAADCAAAGLAVCPDMASVFSLELSPGLDPAVIPLPAAAWLLLSAFGGLGLPARRNARA